MMYFMRDGKEVYVRQACIIARKLMAAVLVGSMSELKEFVRWLRSSNSYSSINLYAQNAETETPNYVNTVNPCYSGTQSGHPAVTFYRKIEGSDFYELIILDGPMYKSQQLLQNNISTEADRFHILMRYNDVKDAFHEEQESHGDTPTKWSVVNIDLLSEEKAFQDEVYRYISLSCSVPVLREWIPAMLRENRASSSRYQFLLPYSSYMEHYWETDEEDRLVVVSLQFRLDAMESLISRMIKEGTLSFGNEVKSGKIDNVKSLNAYLEIFGDDLVQKAHAQFNPLFVPGVSVPTEQAEFFFQNSQYYGNLNFFDSQKDVTSSIALSLNRNKRTIVVGECGVGKTAIAIGSIYTHTRKDNPVTLVMSPGHMVEKWATEIGRLYPFARTCIISDIQDVLKWEKNIRKKKLTSPLFLIVGKDACKMDYEKRPRLLWDSFAHCYIDPTVIQKENQKSGQQVIRVKYEGRGYGRSREEIPWYDNEKGIVPDAVTYFLKPGEKNQFIDVSGDWREKYLTTRRLVNYDNVVSIWTAANPDNPSEWVKVPGTGWINTKVAREYTNRCDIRVKAGAVLDKTELKAYTLARAALNDTVTHGIRRCNISDYIRRRIPLDYFIADEVHLYSSKDTAQGKAFGNFLHAAKYTLALTGTLLNGYAHNIFSMLFRMYPSTFIQNGFRYSNMTEFAKQYGVIEKIEEYENIYHGGHRAIKTSEKFKPGVSPLLFSKFLLDKAVFVTLSDITSDLPNYEEIPVGVDMDMFTKEGYDDFYERSQSVIATDPEHLEKYIFKIVQRLNQYPDQPYDQIPIFNNDTQEQIICPNNAMSRKGVPSQKDMKVLELVQKHIENNEKVLVYVNWVNASDCVSRLQALFKENNIKASFLTASTQARNREKWIQDQVNSGIDVMICNPALVETGLDLLDFTTIIFYQMGYNLFTMRQASRRSLRLNQSHDVTVYFMYFKDTIQENIISLMANKLQAAMAIEGKFSEEGLNALSENDTLLTQLANNLTKNIDVKLEEGAFDFHTIKAQTSGNRFKKKTEVLMKNWFFPVRQAPKGREKVNLPLLLKQA